MKAEELLTPGEKERIKSAILTAEKNTSGEIRVHLDNYCEGDVLDRAALIFETLKMHKTGKRNGVLFYLAIRDKKFAILGDAGINAVTPDDFWDKIKDTMLLSFSKDDFTEGICKGIEMAGKALKDHFPYHDKDINELSDDISFGKD